MISDSNTYLGSCADSADFIWAKSLLDEYLSATGCFHTLEREHILRVAVEQERPFSAKDLQALLKDVPHQPSTATIYSTLDLFCRSNILFRIGHNQGILYLSNRRIHQRLLVICRECGKIVYQRRTKLFTQFCRVIVPRFYKINPIMLASGYCSECHYKLGTLRRNEKKMKKKTNRPISQ